MPELFCRSCALPLPDGGEHCFQCRRQPPKFRFLRAGGLYQGKLRTLLHQFKYQGKDYLVNVLGDVLVQTYRNYPELTPYNNVMAVPAHWWRRWRRGYNQAELLARYLAQQLNLEWLPKVLYRCRITRRQAKLSPKERQKNLQGAFALNRRYPIRGKHILLIDDICTTRTTLNECTYLLRQAGARSVAALVVARDSIPQEN